MEGKAERRGKVERWKRRQREEGEDREIEGKA
jgi:hypothetical protein